MGTNKVYFNMDKLPESIRNLIIFSVERLNPIEIILFGSRARSDYRENSDFDIAFKLDVVGRSKWSHFLSDVEEKSITLYDLDLVDLDQLDSNYLVNIKKEGMILYGISPT